MKCETCNGSGLLLTDFKIFRFGEGFYRFMTSGREPRRDAEGNNLGYEFVCHHCDGSGQVIHGESPEKEKV